MAPREGTDRVKLPKLMNVTPAELERPVAACGSLALALSGVPVRRLPAAPALASP